MADGTGSTLSSSGCESGVAVAAPILLEHLNEFSIQCQIQPIRRPWLVWDKDSDT